MGAANPPPLTAHLTSTSHTNAPGTASKGIHLGREEIDWHPGVWERIDRAVNYETHRSRVLAKFLHHKVVDPHTLSVPAETIFADAAGTLPFNYTNILASAQAASSSGTPANIQTAVTNLQTLPNGMSLATAQQNLLQALAASQLAMSQQVSPLVANIPEGLVIPINEYSIEILLTPAQVKHENEFKETHHEHHEPHDHPEHHDAHKASKHPHYSIAATLAAKAANILSTAHDGVGLAGQLAISNSPFFKSGVVFNRGTPSDYGLLGIGPAGSPQQLPASQVVKVPQVGTAPTSVEWSSATVGAVFDAIAILQSNGQYGPYACVLYYVSFADAYNPLVTTLILPADRIAPVMTDGFFGTAAMPGIPNPVFTNPAAAALPAPLSAYNPNDPNAQAMGLVISTGGNTVELVTGLHPITAFRQKDPNGNFRLSVVERYAFAVNDSSALVRLEFA